MGSCQTPGKITPPNNKKNLTSPRTTILSEISNLHQFWEGVGGCTLC